MSLRAVRLLFLVYVLALCALAISNPSFERGGALLLLTLGLTGLMWQMDLGIVSVDSKDDLSVEGEDDGENSNTST